MSCNMSNPAATYRAVIVQGTNGAAPEDVGELKHHVKNGKGFRNPWVSCNKISAVQIVKEILWRILSGKPITPDTTSPSIPIIRPSLLPQRFNPTAELRATWLGHACYFIEFPSGIRVLFDPVLDPRCSPFSWLGPKRFTSVPCRIADIPFIDAVVISHNHYDHLSYPTIMEIHKTFPEAQFFVPKGNKQWFQDSGIQACEELDWWEERVLKLFPVSSNETPGTESGVVKKEIVARIGCLPCQHESGRSLFDAGHTLWSSWSVESEGKNVWFGGDTGYRTVPQLPAGTDDYDHKYDFPHCPAFKQIGKLRGPFDLGLIPIGAYNPRWMCSPVHANPFDSVNIFMDTKCRRAMGIHWGTWALALEEAMEPPKLLKDALRQKGIPEEGVFDVCGIGETSIFGDAPESPRA